MVITWPVKIFLQIKVHNILECYATEMIDNYLLVWKYLSGMAKLIVCIAQVVQPVRTSGNFRNINNIWASKNMLQVKNQILPAMSVQ